MQRGGIVGPPMVPMLPRQYTLTVVDGLRNEAQTTFALAGRLPMFGAATVEPQHYRRGENIVPVIMPAKTGE